MEIVQQSIFFAFWNYAKLNIITFRQAQGTKMKIIY